MLSEGMSEQTTMLQIAIDKVAYVILRARAVDAKSDAWDEEESVDRDDLGADTILEDMPGDATRQELREFLDSLNEDEQASLLALAWIGRGTYAPAEFDEAFATAKAEHGSDPTAYLLSLPLLSDYLEDALDQLGYSLGDVEQHMLRST